MKEESTRIIENLKRFKKENPNKEISILSMLLHHKLLKLNIFDLYENEKENEKFKPAVKDFLKLRKKILECENESILVDLSMASSKEETKLFLKPLGLSIKEAKKIMENLKNEEFFMINFD